MGPDPAAAVPLDQQTRLRDAFAQLMLENNQPRQAVPMEAVWKAQMGQQMPQMAGPPPGGGMPLAPEQPGLNFPIAPGGGAGVDQPPPQEPKTPFPGAKSVEVKPYDLPKSKKAKKGKD